MSDDRRSTEPVAKPRKPYQFTVRTFFAAALWLGLLMAAVTTVKERGALGTAILFLAWIAFAELYRRLRATRAMVALGTGPVVLLALWSVVLVAADAPLRGGEVLPPVFWFLMYAFAWGIVLSVVVIIERGVEHWLIGAVYRCRRSRVSEVPGGAAPVPLSGRLRFAAILFAIHTALALIPILTWLGRSTLGADAGILLVVVADVPVKPVYSLIPGIDPPDEMPDLALASLVLGGALYAVVGWLVAYLAERFEPRARAVGPPEGASRDVCPAPDGRDA